MQITRIRVSSQFIDSETGKVRNPGETIEITDADRAKSIVANHLGNLLGITHTWCETTKQPKILVYISLLARIGGIETAIKNMAKAFQDRNLVFIVKQYDDEESLFDLGKNHKVILDSPENRYQGDVLLIMNFDGAAFIGDRAKAKKVYEFCHCDWNGLKEINCKLKLSKYPGAKYIAVSETCKKGLKDVWGENSTVVTNILLPTDIAKPISFLFMSRATEEKGVDVLLDMLKKFDEAGKDYVVFLCSQIYQAKPEIQRRITANGKIVIIPASRYANKLLLAADYLVQMSSSESYCYAVREALGAGVPCIVSDIPELRKVIKDGKNGYVVKRDLSNLDIDKIFNQIPSPYGYTEEISPLWEKIMDGEL